MFSKKIRPAARFLTIPCDQIPFFSLAPENQDGKKYHLFYYPAKLRFFIKVFLPMKRHIIKILIEQIPGFKPGIIGLTCQINENAYGKHPGAPK
jgi:hypothetical protein